MDKDVKERGRRLARWLVTAALVFAVSYVARTTQLGLAQMRADGRSMDYAVEWIATKSLTSWRERLIAKPGDERGLLYHLLTAIEGEFYESAMRKLPENDPERAVYWFRQYLAPFRNFRKRQYADELTPGALANLELIANAEPSTPWFRDVGQFEMATLIGGYCSNVALTSLPVDAKLREIKAALLDSVKIYSRLDARAFYARRRDAWLSALPGLIVHHELGTFNFLFKDESFSCSQSDLIDAYRQFVAKFNSESAQILSVQKTLPLEEEIVQQLEDYIGQARSSKVLAEKCNIVIDLNQPTQRE